MKFNDFDQIWMVKSAGMVLGPFTWSELKEAVLERKVSSIDEVRNPYRRWSLLKESPELEDIAKLAQNAVAVHEVTDSAIDLDETKRDWPTVPGAHGTLIPVKKISQDPSPKISSAKTTNSQTPSPSSNSWNLPKPQVTPMKKNPQESKNAWLPLAVGVLLALFIVFLVFYFIQPNAVSKEKMVDYLSMARQARDKGLFESSLRYFNMGREHKTIHFAEQFEFVPLLLLKGSELKLVEQLLKPENDTNRSPRVDLWRALLQMRMGHFPEAQKRLDGFVQQNPEDLAAHLNHWVNSHFLESEPNAPTDMKFFESHQRSDVLISWAPALRALRKFDQQGSKLDADALNKITENLRKTLSESPPFGFQSLLLVLSLQLKSGNQPSSELMTMLVEQDPLRQNQQILDLEIDSQLFESSLWNELCERNVSQLKSPIFSKVVSAQCRLYQGLWEAAIQDLKGMSETGVSTSDPLSGHQQLAIAYWKSHRLREAVYEASQSQTAVSQYVRGRACLEMKDFPCVEKILNHLQNTMSVKNEYNELKVRSEILQDRREQAAKDLQKMLMESPHYLPFVELSEEIFSGT